MKISKIEIQKKNKKRSSIFIDGEFRLGLTTDIVIKYGLKEGDQITEEDIKNLLLTQEKEYLKQRAYRLLRYQNRSINELKERLTRLGYEPDIVEMAISDLIEEGILDDQKFARGFVNNYTEINPKGNIFIMNELKKRKIEPSVIEAIIKNRDEKGIIKTLLQNRFPNFDKKDIKQKAKAVRYLMGRGFTTQAIYGSLGEDYD